MKMLFAAAMLLCGPAQATQPSPLTKDISPLTDERLNAGLELGQEIEARVDGDLNGDGDVDTAYIVASPDERILNVVHSVRNAGMAGQTLAGQLRLPADPLGAAGLTIRKGVLVIEDLTGGTTALAATYRYRADTAEPRMRLIGLDATIYSRTFAHDGNAMSWNLVTGDVETKMLKLAGSGEDAIYRDAFVRRFKKPGKLLYMADTPDPEEQLIAFTRAK